MNLSLCEQLAKPAAPKTVRRQKPKPSPVKAARKAAKAEESIATTLANKEQTAPLAQPRRRIPRDVILARIPGVRLRHPANGEYHCDNDGPYIKFRDNHVTIRVRGNLDGMEPRKTRYVVGDLTVIARIGQSGRRFVFMELTLPEEETEMRFEAYAHPAVLARRDNWVSTFYALEENTGAVTIYRQQESNEERIAA